MTGAELRAWRERLGKDEAWVEATLAPLTGCGDNGRDLRRAAEDGPRDALSTLRTAYRAALEAEEARQAAECGPVEPVCPEGVYAWNVGGDLCMHVQGARPGNSFLAVRPDGTIRASKAVGEIPPASTELLEYAAALSRYRAAIHAASDRQRKLDAVRAAEEAHKVTDAACDAARRSKRDAEDKYTTAYEAAIKTARALDAALREAGL